MYIAKNNLVVTMRMLSVTGSLHGKPQLQLSIL